MDDHILYFIIFYSKKAKYYGLLVRTTTSFLFGKPDVIINSMRIERSGSFRFTEGDTVLFCETCQAVLMKGRGEESRQFRKQATELALEHQYRFGLYHEPVLLSSNKDRIRVLIDSPTGRREWIPNQLAQSLNVWRRFQRR